MKLTTNETLILKAVNSKPNDWLTHHRVYLGDVLALQAKGLVITRIDGEQLQVRTRTPVEDNVPLAQFGHSDTTNL